MNSNYADKYLESCNLDFDIYAKSIQPMISLIQERDPIDNQNFRNSVGKEVPFLQLSSDEEIKSATRIYNATIRAKVLDILRGLLPASTLTNVGITGNGRAFEYLLTILYSSSLQEEKMLALKMHNELDTTIKSFVKRANDLHGQSLQKYLSELRRSSLILSAKYLKNKEKKGFLVKLIDYESAKKAEEKVISAILYEHTHGLSYKTILPQVKKMNPKIRKKIIKLFSGLRQNRRHRPSRAFEMTEYTFDLLTNFGMFRDLHRHRPLTLERQLLTTDHGFTLPDEVSLLGIEKEFKDSMYKAKEVFDLMQKKMPGQAQYVVNFAYKYPYFIKLNLREATHLIELRTVPQGHPDYRKVAQEMFKSIKKVHPILSQVIKFVDLNEYKLERLEAEKKIEEKRKKITSAR